jgi:hypothetical protein
LAGVTESGARYRRNISRLPEPGCSNTKGRKKGRKWYGANAARMTWLCQLNRVLLSRPTNDRGSSASSSSA